jgi:hypothetical protein
MCARLAEQDPTIRFLKWFFGIPLLVSGLAAVALPPVLAGALIWQGAQSSRVSWIGLGAASGAIYFLLVFSLVRSAWRKLRTPPKE